MAVAVRSLRARRGAGRGPIRPPSPEAVAGLRVQPSGRRSRNLAWGTIGVMVVVGGLLVGVLMIGSADQRVPVVIAAKPLVPGRPVTRADMQVTEMSAGVGVVSVSPVAAAKLVGQVPLGPVPTGAVLHAGMFTSGSPLTASETVVGAALDPGAAPSGTLKVGDQVSLVVTPKPTNATPGTPSVIGIGSVWSVEELSATSRKVWVSLRVDAALGPVVAQASSEGTLRLLLVGGTPA